MPTRASSYAALLALCATTCAPSEPESLPRSLAGAVPEIRDDGEFTLRDDRLQLRWSQAPGQVAGYRISLLAGAEDAAQVVPWRDVGTAQSVRLKGLKLTPGILYLATVRAYDQLGVEGPMRFSDGIAVDLQPPGAPPRVAGPVEAVAGLVSFSWEAAPDDGRVTAYEAALVAADLLAGPATRWTRLPEDSPLSARLPASGLHEGGHYRVAVRAEDAAGRLGPPAYGPVFLHDRLAPGDLQVRVSPPAVRPDGAITARWTEAVDAGGVIGYRVRVHPAAASDTAAAIERAMGPVLSVTLPVASLGPERPYQVSVRAEDSTGKLGGAGWSPPFYVDATPPTVPERVSAAGPYWTPPLAPMVRWSPSEDDAGIAAYRVTLVDQNQRIVHAELAHGESLQARLGGLEVEDGSVLRACVAAEDGAGHVGPAGCSEPVTVDLWPPQAPAWIDDGALTPATRYIVLRFGEATDNLGIAGYEAIALGAPQIDAALSPWTRVGPDARDIRLRLREPADDGALLWTAVRAVDHAGQYGPATLSDGVRVLTRVPAAPREVSSTRPAQRELDRVQLHFEAPAGGETPVEYEATVVATGQVPAGDWQRVEGPGTTWLEGLRLLPGTSYRVAVRARGAAGVPGPHALGSGFTVDRQPPQLKLGLADGGSCAYAAEHEQRRANAAGLALCGQADDGETAVTSVQLRVRVGRDGIWQDWSGAPASLVDRPVWHEARLLPGSEGRVALWFALPDVAGFGAGLLELEVLGMARDLAGNPAGASDASRAELRIALAPDPELSFADDGLIAGLDASVDWALAPGLRGVRIQIARAPGDASAPVRFDAQSIVYDETFDGGVGGLDWRAPAYGLYNVRAAPRFQRGEPPRLFGPPGRLELRRWRAVLPAIPPAATAGVLGCAPGQSCVLLSGPASYRSPAPATPFAQTPATPLRHARAIAVSRAKTTQWLAGDAAGLAQSLDQGRSWYRLGAPLIGEVQAIDHDGESFYIAGSLGLLRYRGGEDPPAWVPPRSELSYAGVACAAPGDCVVATSGNRPRLSRVRAGRLETPAAAPSVRALRSLRWHDEAYWLLDAAGVLWRADRLAQRWTEVAQLEDAREVIGGGPRQLFVLGATTQLSEDRGASFEALRGLPLWRAASRQGALVVLGQDGESAESASAGLRQSPLRGAQSPFAAWAAPTQAAGRAAYALTAGCDVLLAGAGALRVVEGPERCASLRAIALSADGKGLYRLDEAKLWWNDSTEAQGFSLPEELRPQAGGSSVAAPEEGPVQIHDGRAMWLAEPWRSPPRFERVAWPCELAPQQIVVAGNVHYVLSERRVWRLDGDARCWSLLQGDGRFNEARCGSAGHGLEVTQLAGGNALVAWTPGGELWWAEPGADAKAEPMLAGAESVLPASPWALLRRSGALELLRRDADGDWAALPPPPTTPLDLVSTRSGLYVRSATDGIWLWVGRP